MSTALWRRTNGKYFSCTYQEVETEDGEATEDDPLPKASTKKKPPKAEENRSKKEHVNVVFIGHVGEFGDCKSDTGHVLIS